MLTQDSLARTASNLRVEERTWQNYQFPDRLKLHREAVFLLLCEKSALNSNIIRLHLGALKKSNTLPKD